MFKRLIDSEEKDLSIAIFEAKKQLGSGMPYSLAGANIEHITNVSGNEIPRLVTSTTKWLSGLSGDMLQEYGLTPDGLTEYMVFPRLLFGDYLTAQFDLLLKKAQEMGIQTALYAETTVTDIIDNPEQRTVTIELAGREKLNFDTAIICTGHNWPVKNEGQVKGYFDSPYPPSKLALRLDHPVAIRGSSLTAIDAIRTIARHNGEFIRQAPHKLVYHANPDAKNFKIILHSKHGLLPAVRFHLEDPRLSKTALLSREEIAAHMRDNQGFLSLDFIFEKDFKASVLAKDPELYARIKSLSIEQFVDMMMAQREMVDPFLFFKLEYIEAQQSIERRESVYWKELLATLSFAMNYPAKHLSAEDMLRLQAVLMPLISIVIAFVPQSSCEELMALHDAGRLELLAVGEDSRIEIDPTGGIRYHLNTENGKSHAAYYNTFIDCIGQRHLNLDAFPFRTLVDKGTVSGARLKFRSVQMAAAQMKAGDQTITADAAGDFYLTVPGIAVDDNFSVRDSAGRSNPRLFVMAVPYIGGFNPDYSGLDFCEEASRLIAERIFSGGL